MPTRDQIVAEARKWLNTPYRPQAAVLGHGVDCVNLVHEVYIGAGVYTRFSLPAYRSRPDGTLLTQVQSVLVKVPKIEADAGDVLVFNHETMGPSHLGILTSKNSIIHAYMTNRKVVEHTIDDRWRKLISAAFRANGVA